MKTRDVFADRELVSALADQVELLAIADAISCVASPSLVAEAADGRQSEGELRLDEVSRPRRALTGRVRGRTRSFIVGVVVVAVVAAAPTLAFSAALREFVGLQSRAVSAKPRLAAVVTGVRVENRLVGAYATVRFTAGEVGMAPGTGIPSGSVVLVSMLPVHGSPTRLIKAVGGNGHYQASGWVPRGGIRSVQVGMWLNRVDSPTAADGFWIPVTIPDRSL